ncbi:NosD domain-containing protein [Candidatus Zixiibacteriota bacterium]
MNLTGESGSTAIDAQGRGYGVSVNGADNVTISGFMFTNDGEWTNWCVYLNGATNTTVIENHFLDKGTGLYESHDNSVINNVYEGQAAILLGTSWGNLIEGNQLHVSFPG